MTEQQTDRERRAMWRQIATDAGDDPYVNTLHPDEVLALLDQLEQAEADRDWLLRSSRLAKEERINANARAERAEARIEAWEKQYDHDLAQADLIADQAEARIAEEKHLRMKATAAATKAEARIKAVEDVLDAWDRFEHHDLLEVGIRRALDLPYLGAPDECCGRGICALGQGHSGPCRC